MSETTSLSALRARIDETDRAIVALLAERRTIVRALRDLKEAQALPRVDPAREARMRDALAEEAARLEVPRSLVDAVLDAILLDSRALVSAPRER